MFMQISSYEIPSPHEGGWAVYDDTGMPIEVTVSDSWLQSFIYANATSLVKDGLISAAPFITWENARIATGTAITVLGTISTLSGIRFIPAAFLGLTPVGWAVLSVSTVGLGVMAYFMVQSHLARLNEERVKGGLEVISTAELVELIQDFERKAMTEILKRLAVERDDIVMLDEGQVEINGSLYDISHLRYVAQEDGAQSIIAKQGRWSFSKTILTLAEAKPALQVPSDE